MPQVNTTTSRDVTFHSVTATGARELLSQAFQGSVTLREGEDIDLYGIEYVISDDDVLQMLGKVLAGYKVSTTREYHEDGTITHHPCLRE